MRIATLFLFMPFVLFAQIDSLRSALDKRDSSTETVDLLNDAAKEVRKTDPSAMEKFAESALKMADELNYDEGKGEAFLNIGISYWERNRHADAMEKYFDALEVYENLDRPDRVARIRMNIGNAYDDLGQTAKAKVYIKEALETMKTTGDSSAISSGILNLGVIHFYQQEYDSALQCFDYVLDYRISVKDTSGIALAHLNLANVYEYKKDLKNAVKNYRLAREFVKHGETLKVNIELGLGNALLLIGKERDGFAILDSAIAQAVINEQSSMIQFGYEAKKKYYTRKGDFEKAMEQQSKEIETEREWRGKEVQSQVEVINLKYEDEKKARELAALKAEKKEQDLYFLILILSIGFLMIVGISLVIAFRLKIKNGRLKQAELQQKIEHKNRELASYALNFIQKNELLSDLSEKVTAVKSEASQKISGQLNQLNSMINGYMRIDQDWENFKRMFEEVHPDFIVRLKNVYPDLGNADLKLCALLRLNLNLKESSQILGISSDSVKTARSRLRKKLGMETSENVVDFLIRFDGDLLKIA